MGCVKSLNWKLEKMWECSVWYWDIKTCSSNQWYGMYLWYVFSGIRLGHQQTVIIRVDSDIHISSKCSISFGHSVLLGLLVHFGYFIFNIIPHLDCSMPVGLKTMFRHGWGFESSDLQFFPQLLLLFIFQTMIISIGWFEWAERHAEIRTLVNRPLHSGEAPIDIVWELLRRSSGCKAHPVPVLA